MAEVILRAKLRAVRGLRDQFENCLIGNDEAKWQTEAIRFLRREPCWKKPNPKARIFTLNPAPFDPTNFVGKGWTVWRGPADGKGLEGAEAQDARSLALLEVDMSSIRFENMLNEEDGEQAIKGEEKILRLKMAKFVRFDARLGRELLAESGQATLEWLYRERGVTWLDLPGTILRGPSGKRYVLCLSRDDGRWLWDANWLEYDWGRGSPSAVQASQFHFSSVWRSFVFYLFRTEFLITAI